MKPVNWDVLSSSLIALGMIGLDHEAIQEIDVNPLIICDGDPVVVDALVVLKATSAKD